MKQEHLQIRALKALTAEIEPLVLEAEREGHHFMRRLCDDWASGSNRFEGPGEVFLGAFAADQLAGVGGLNRDPYADADEIGRLRHVYVLAAARRLQVGSLLVGRITSDAAKTFSVVRLRTATAEAAVFYERLGFDKTCEDHASHRLVCRKSP